MTLNEFRAAYPNESNFVEWKSGSGRKPIQNAIVAFSNTDGGVLMIGVDDRGAPVGKPFDSNLEKELWETINQIESPGSIQLNSLTVGNVDVTVVSISQRRQGVAQTSDGRILARKGKQNLPLTGTDLMELMKQRVHDSFDAGPSRWPLADADAGLLEELCAAFGIDSSLSMPDLADALEERGLVSRPSGRPMLTNAGAIFLIPGAPSAFGKCYVEVFRFPQNATEHDLRKVFDGSPTQQVDRATAWIDNELGFDLVVVGRRRHELPRLPARALREVIANAVAHRDYQLAGSAVEIRISPREVVVVSPGGFVAPVTSDNLHNAHASRNRRVIQVLRAFGLAEDAGRGIRVVRDEMSDNLRAEPRFLEEPPGHVTVRLPIESPFSPEERAWVRELEYRTDLLPTDRRVLIEAARGKELTNSDIRSLLGIDSSTARQTLQRLRDTGLLEQDGERRGARYRIVLDLGRPAWAGLDDAGLREAVLRMAEEAPLTNTLVRDRLNLSRAEALRLLSGLVADGLLALRGSKRGSHYVLEDSTRVARVETGNGTEL